MASNSFGTIFKITTWGEAHGKAIGVVIDGCPAGLEIDEETINAALALRAPGKSPYTSPRKENDQAEILSGIFEGKTTGTPISILIHNTDAHSTPYESTKNLLKPGHAQYTYLQKYGIFDYRGSGRASARETACRVAAGAVAKKLLNYYGIEITAYLKAVGNIKAEIDTSPISSLQTSIYESPLYCPNPEATAMMATVLKQALDEGDSLGGVVEFLATSVPVGLGDPLYAKLEALLAHAMMSLPASKGFEIGSGFQSATLQGSKHNDLFIQGEKQIETETNHAGGILGGISNGMPIIGRVAFKPASSIKKEQTTLSIEGKPSTFKLAEGSRHDPCVAIRAVPIVEAMAALVLADALLLNRCAQL